MCVGNNDRCSLRTTTAESPLRNIKAFNCVSPDFNDGLSLAEFSHDVNGQHFSCKNRSIVLHLERF